MDISTLLLELYGRIPPLADAAVDGLTATELTTPPAPTSNSIGWLIWHLTRVQDHHVAELLETSQLWEGGDWAPRFGLSPDPSNTGYRHDADDVAAVRADGPDVLHEYLAAVHSRTCDFLVGVEADGLDQIVDRRWDPPVTLGVRLISVADDCLQHVGQANYARGLLGF